MTNGRFCYLDKISILRILNMIWDLHSYFVMKAFINILELSIVKLGIVQNSMKEILNAGLCRIIKKHPELVINSSILIVHSIHLFPNEDTAF